MNENEPMFGRCLPRNSLSFLVKDTFICNSLQRMATVKFRLKSASKRENTIYIYLSMGRGHLFEVRTGFAILPQDWQVKNGLPKQNTAENKVLYSDLKQLDSYVTDAINRGQSKGELIDKFWLEQKVFDCFNRVLKTDQEILVNHIQYIIDNAHTRIVRGRNTVGLSVSRVKGYQTFLSIVKQYQLHIKRTIRLTEISNLFVEDFTRWLLNTHKCAMSYAGKQIDNLKTVCTDAERLGIPVHPFARNIQSFTEANEDRYIITLSFEEQRLIREAKMPNNSLENARKWLLIGCELGQRGEDFLSVTANRFRQTNGFFTVDVLQKKTKKEVTIAVMKPDIIAILETAMPHQISLQKFNIYIKQVCKIAGLDELTQGYKVMLNTDKKRRKVFGKYPKWELITSHSCRRSFATNYYKKIATPILMSITGHSREGTFLKYINKHIDKDDNATLFALQYQKMMNG